jgi:hypothetical protein
MQPSPAFLISHLKDILSFEQDHVCKSSPLASITVRTRLCPLTFQVGVAGYRSVGGQEELVSCADGKRFTHKAEVLVCLSAGCIDT